MVNASAGIELRNRGDPPPADDFFAVVKHRRLAGGDGALRREELDSRLAGRAARNDLDSRRRRQVLVADFDCGLQQFALPDRTHPVDVADQAAAPEEFLVRTYHHAIALAVQLDDIERRSDGHSESLPLADRIVVETVVLAKNTAIRGHDVAWPALELHALLGEIGLNEVSIAAARNKTDLLAFRLFGHRQPLLAGNRAHPVFGQLAQREDRARELLLRQAEEKIGLVLGAVDGGEQPVPARGLVAPEARVGAPGGAGRGRLPPSLDGI